MATSLYPKDLAAIFNDSPFLDDGSDRANRIYMPLLLLGLCTITGLKQFAGSPIECYTESSLNSKQHDYVTSFCWTASTYQILDTKYDAFRRPIGTDHLIDGHKSASLDSATMSGKKVYVSYYQWVPVILAVQAVLFHLPFYVWWSLNKRGSLHFPHLMYGLFCLSKVQTNPIGRKTLRDDAAFLLDSYLGENLKKPESRIQIPSGFKITAIFFFVKMLYLSNIVFQLACLHSFLQANILEYCFDCVNTVIFQQKWLMSERFPIRTICEFAGAPQIHGYTLPHTCHCVLPINLYNDKFYAVIVLLMMCLLIFSVVSLLIWLYRLFSCDMRLSMVKTLVTEKDSKFLNRFISHYLRYDGLLILNLVYQNIGSNTGKEIAKSLLEKYKEYGHEGSDASSEDSMQKEPLSGSNSPAWNLNPLRCHSCSSPWASKDEGQPCPKCKGILRSNDTNV